MTRIFLNDEDVTDEIDISEFDTGTSAILKRTAPAATTVAGRWASSGPRPEQTVEYLRDNYPDDPVIGSIAELIDKNRALWYAIQVMPTAEYGSGDGLVNWRIDTIHELDDVMRHHIELDTLNKKAGVTGGRSKS